MLSTEDVGLAPPNDGSWEVAGDMASDDVDDEAPAPAYAEK